MESTGTSQVLPSTHDTRRRRMLLAIIIAAALVAVGWLIYDRFMNTVDETTGPTEVQKSEVLSRIAAESPAIVSDEVKTPILERISQESSGSAVTEQQKANFMGGMAQ